MKKQHILVSAILFALAAYAQAADTAQVKITAGPILVRGGIAIYAYLDATEKNLDTVYKAIKWPDGRYTADIQKLDNNAMILNQKILTGQEAQHLYEFLEMRSLGLG